MNFPEKLKQLREQKGWTQAELGKLLGKSANTISRYELGLTYPRYRKDFAKMAELFEVSESYLLTDEQEFIFNVKEFYGARGAKQAKELTEELVGLMAGGELAEEDKRVIFETIQTAYVMAKEENKKYIPKKYRKENDES